jgi:hypothetical protein
MHLKRSARPDLSHYSAHRPSDPPAWKRHSWREARVKPPASAPRGPLGIILPCFHLTHRTRQSKADGHICKTSIHCPFAEVSNDHLHNVPTIKIESRQRISSHASLSATGEHRRSPVCEPQQPSPRLSPSARLPPERPWSGNAFAGPDGPGFPARKRINGYRIDSHTAFPFVERRRHSPTNSQYA